MEWSDFKVLLALSRAGSVAGAARELKVDNSTISRRLSTLEDAMGAKLLIRGGREFTWTPEGRTALAAADAMEAAAAAALRAVRSSKVDLDGTVRISVAPAFIEILAHILVPDLRKAHPALHTEFQSAYLRCDLARGDADIALRMARPEEPDLIGRRAFDCGWFVYASHEYVAAHGRPATFAQLAQHQLVLYAEQMHNAEPLCWMEAHKGRTRLSRVDSVETACRMAAAGGGITVLPAFTGDPVAGLVRLFPRAVSTNVGWVVYHDTMRDCSRVRIVADALIDFFRSRASIFAGSPVDPTEPGES